MVSSLQAYPDKYQGKDLSEEVINTLSVLISPAGAEEEKINY